MPSIINATTSASTALVTTADTSAVLALQSSGTTGLSVNPGGKVIYPSTTLSTATAGTLEYDGKVPYFTPLETQRGVIAGMQFYRLNATVVGSNATGAQNVFAVGCTLSSNTVYAFELYYNITKSAGTTSHNVSNLFGGTATINNIGYSVLGAQSTTTGTVSGNPLSTQTYSLYVQQATATQFSQSVTTAAHTVYALFKGTVSVNAGGTFIPQYQLSAAPGGAYTTQIGSYCLIYPISASGANTSVGTWA